MTIYPSTLRRRDEEVLGLVRPCNKSCRTHFFIFDNVRRKVLVCVTSIRRETGIHGELKIRMSLEDSFCLRDSPGKDRKNLLLLRRGLFGPPRMVFIHGQGVIVEADGDLSNLGMDRDGILGVPGNQEIVLEKGAKDLLARDNIKRNSLVTIPRNEYNRNMDERPGPI